MYFSGQVHSIIFENSAQAFYILKMVLDSEGEVEGLDSLEEGVPVTVRGDIPGLSVDTGTWFGFEGKWDDHPQFGKQIRILRAPIFKDWSADTCEKILVGQGVGFAVASKLRAAFGDDLAQCLMDPEKIESVPGLTKFSALHVHNRWVAARAHFQALEFLNDLNLPQGRIRQIWTLFGDQAEEVLAKNPWALVQIEGVTFSDADQVANRLHLDTGPKNLSRIEGAVLHACRSGKGFGHLFSSSGDILGVVRTIDPRFEDVDIAKAIKNLSSQGHLVLDRTSRPGTVAVYDPWSYKIEQESARLLRERVKSAVLSETIEKIHIRSLLGEEETASSLSEAVGISLDRHQKIGALSLSKEQAKGVRNALCEPVSIISGLPGTGKTTSLKMAVSLLQEAGINFLIVAPTGIAAKRVSSVTGAPASTIHRAFRSGGKDRDSREATYVGVVGDNDFSSNGTDGSSEEWGFSQDNPHPADVIIADESSMIDQHLIYRILTCTRPDARLVLVGDAAQLPSVGPGNVLRDLISSGLFPTVSLTEIFRQADTSPIIHAAHAIHRGDVPEAPRGTDFSLYEVSDEEAVANLVIAGAEKLFNSSKDSSKKKVPPTTFQVLSPRHSGPVGVTTLNARLRELLNPKSPSLREMKMGSDTIREEDRIMVVRNDYDLGIFNGDVGKVVLIDRKAKEVEIKIHGPPVLNVRVPFAKVPQVLRLAYAITVHKSQGQEYDVILMPVVNSFAQQLQRNLLYTAVTRARKKVLLVGTRSALVRAVANDRESARNTLFRDRLLLKEETQ